MPREIVVVDWCDVCFREGVKSEGEPVVVRIGWRKADKPRQPVFCDVHRKEYLGALEELLADVAVFDPGADAPGPSSAAAVPRPATGEGSRGPRGRNGEENPTPCLVCERVFNIDHVAKNPQSAHTHRLQRHGIGSVDYKAWLRGDAEVVEADKKSLKVVLKLKPLPPKDDTSWQVPDDFKCDRKGCKFMVDPRDYEDQSTAFRVLGSHKAAHAR